MEAPGPPALWFRSEEPVDPPRRARNPRPWDSDPEGSERRSGTSASPCGGGGTCSTPCGIWVGCDYRGRTEASVVASPPLLMDQVPAVAGARIVGNPFWAEMTIQIAGHKGTGSEKWVGVAVQIQARSHYWGGGRLARII